jgi:hypothetical protein
MKEKFKIHRSHSRHSAHVPGVIEPHYGAEMAKSAGFDNCLARTSVAWIVEINRCRKGNPLSALGFFPAVAREPAGASVRSGANFPARL